MLSLIYIIMLRAEMRESLVGVGHTVDILLALEGGTLFLVSGLDFGGQLEGHGLLTALARETDEVLHADALLALGADFGGDLEGGTADTLAAHLDAGRHIGQGLLPHLEAVLFGALADHVDCIVEDAVGDGLLAAHHQVVDELRHLHVIVFGIRKDDSFLGFSFSHFSLNF